MNIQAGIKIIRPIWPLAIAPWQVHICCVRADDAEVRSLGEELYARLQSAGAEVIYDDRQVSAGVMFSDADLLGVPYRVIISPRNLKEGCCELLSRDKKLNCKISPDELPDKIKELLAQAGEQF